MKCNGFDSDQYRYFHLINSKAWSGCTNFSYGRLRANDIIKFSLNDLKSRLLSSNYDAIEKYIYPHSIVEYPETEPFDWFKYIMMQKPITFRENGSLYFIYQEGEYAMINEWMKQKMSSKNPSKAPLSTSIFERNREVLNMISGDEKLCSQSGVENELLALSRNMLPEEIKNQLFKFKVETPFELDYQKNETWPLTNPSVFLALLNQDFIRILANSIEILGHEKELIFIKEYQDNIPNTTRRYYQVKDNITVLDISDLSNSCCLEDYGVQFESLVIRMNEVNVDIVKENPNHFKKDGSIKYFYVDYKDHFHDRIVEREIEKIAYRLPKEEALKMELENEQILNQKRQVQNTIYYIQKHQNRYYKFCQRNKDANPEDFIAQEKKQLRKRLIYHLNRRAQQIESKRP